MTDPEQFLNSEPYDLRLPPIALAQPGDEPSVELLARPDIRDGLQRVSDTQSAHLASLADAGHTVRELFRGTTPNGIGVAVAEYTDQDVTGIDPAGSGSVPRFLDRGGQFVVFAYSLEELGTEEGYELATTPRELDLDVPQSREPIHRIDILLTNGGRIGLAIPLEHGRKPVIRQEAVETFRDAAVGERRRALVDRTLGWVRERQAALFGNTRGLDEVGRAALEAQYVQLGEYSLMLRDQLYDMPEQIDTAGHVDIFAGHEARLKEVAREAAKQIVGSREEVESRPWERPYADLLAEAVEAQLRGLSWTADKYMRDRGIIDPEEIEIVRSTMLPPLNQIFVRPPSRDAGANAQDLYTSGYHRNDRTQSDREKAITHALNRYRMQRMGNA